MNNREILDSILRELSARLGKSLGELSADGVVGFSYRDNIPVTIECPATGLMAYLYADFGPLSSLRRERFCYKLLVASHLGHGTGNACFSINDSENSLVLWLGFEVAGLDALEFETMLDDFLQIVSLWDEQFRANEQMPVPTDDLSEFAGIRI